ncbi:hypothetical protein J6590_084164 [Homalodisca vitripennis]|nr:hypothetical protein J6590_084164 [Homalodisca vitripennis]
MISEEPCTVREALKRTITRSKCDKCNKVRENMNNDSWGRRALFSTYPVREYGDFPVGHRQIPFFIEAELSWTVGVGQMRCRKASGSDGNQKFPKHLASTLSGRPAAKTDWLGVCPRVAAPQINKPYLRRDSTKRAVNKFKKNLVAVLSKLPRLINVIEEGSGLSDRQHGFLARPICSKPFRWRRFLTPSKRGFDPQRTPAGLVATLNMRNAFNSVKWENSLTTLWMTSTFVPTSSGYLTSISEIGDGPR